MLLLTLEVLELLKSHLAECEETTSPDTKIGKMRTLDDMERLEDELKDFEKRKEYTKQCLRIGGRDIQDMITNLMCRFMSKDLMCRYNMKGQWGKLSFMKTNVYKIIVDSVLAKYKTATESDIKSVAGQKLRTVIHQG